MERTNAMEQNVIIKCPKCGMQYHFQEIFHPKTVFHPVYNIIRNNQDEIEEVIPESPDLTELYFCDKCDAPLNVTLRLNFDVRIDPKLDFKENTFIIEND